MLIHDVLVNPFFQLHAGGLQQFVQSVGIRLVIGFIVPHQNQRIVHDVEQFRRVNAHDGDKNVIHRVICAGHFGSGVVVIQNGLHFVWFVRGCIRGRIRLQRHEIRRQLVVQYEFVHGQRLQYVRLVGLAIGSYELIYARFGKINEQRIQPMLHRLGGVCLVMRVKFFEAVKHVEQKIQVLLGVVVVPARHGLRIVGGLQRHDVGLNGELGSYGVKREQRNLQNGLQRFQNGLKPFFFSARANRFVEELKCGLHCVCCSGVVNNNISSILFFAMMFMLLAVEVVVAVAAVGNSIIQCFKKILFD